MIYIYDEKNNEIASGTDFVSAVYENYKNNVLVLTEYLTKGSEDGFEITVDIYIDSLDKWFPLCMNNDPEPILFSKFFKETGKKILPLPFPYIVKKIRINVQAEGDTSSLGDINIYLIRDIESKNNFVFI